VVDKASSEYTESLLAKLKERLDPEVWTEVHRLALPQSGGKARWKGPPDSAMERLALASISGKGLQEMTNEDLQAILAAVTRWRQQAEQKKQETGLYDDSGRGLARELARRSVDLPEGCPFRLSKSEQETNFKIAKAVEEEQTIYVIAIDVDTEDAQGEHVPAADARKAAHRWMVESRVIGWNHKQPLKSATAVETYLVPAGLTKLGDETIKEGDWIVGVHISDPVEWERVNKLGTGASIGGYRITGEQDEGKAEARK